MPFYCGKCKPLVKNEQRRKRLKTNPEQQKRLYNANKLWAEKHKDSISEYLKKWRKSENGINSINKYKGSPSYKLKIKRRRLIYRERLNKVVHKFILQDWLLMRNNGICNMCKNVFASKYLELDHIYPLSLANKDFIKTGIKRIYTIKDIQPLCGKCNKIKSDNFETE